MRSPPFSRHVLQRSQTRTLPSDRRTSQPSSSEQGSSCQALFVRSASTVVISFSHGSTIGRVCDNPTSYHAAEMLTPRLDVISSYLWLAGLPRSARSLHRQRLLSRHILVTEDPNEHLVWHESRMFIKPIPTFLFDYQCWVEILCKSTDLYEASCGFLLSYAWLIRYESDWKIAKEVGLVPSQGVDWEHWTELMNDFLGSIDLQGLSGISPRFQYGELRLSRLNKIYYITRLGASFMTDSTWYQSFFVNRFGWLISIFALFSVILSAMQVVLALERGGTAFASASYGFSITALFVAGGTAVVVFLTWAVLFWYYLSRAWMNDRQVRRQRKSVAEKCR